MNISRLSTLSLSLAIAVMTLGYATSAFADKPTGGGHNHGGEAVYTAQLTMGGFIFRGMDNNAIAVTVTPNKRGNSYHSEATLSMSSPGSTDDQGAWDEVFSWCMDLLMTNPPVRVAVADNWTIDNSGGKEAGTVGSDIRIRFKDVEALGFSGVNINFDLIGVILVADGPFLPGEGGTSSFTLTEFVIFGDKKRGESCRSGVRFLSVPSTLEITRTP